MAEPSEWMADPSSGERSAPTGPLYASVQGHGVVESDDPVVQPLGHADHGPPRVAMFVLNPCHIDARVRKEAASLGQAGCDVRVFALGNSQFPEALVDEGAYTIQRLEVSSLYQRTLWRLQALYHFWVAWRQRLGRRGRAGDSDGDVVEPERALGSSDEDREVEGDDTADPPSDRAAWQSHAALWLLVAVLSRLCRVGRGLARLVRRSARRAWSSCRRRARLVVRSTFLRCYGFVRRRLMPIHRPSVVQQFWRVSARAAAAWEPDVCHAHDLNVLPGAAKVARESGAALVYDSHELWRRRNRHGELRPLARVVDAFQERRLIGRADLVITVSPGIQTWLQRRYDLRAPVEVVRNVPLRRQVREGPPLRELASLSDERIVMYTGRITSGRGLEETVDALAELPEHVVLVLLGYGDDLFVRQLHHRADRRGVAHRVRQVPPVTPDQVAAVASQADCALVAIEPVCLSYYYTLPNKLFEAIQAGLPVLASDLPDMRTIVEGYGIGRLFRTGRPGEVRDGLRALLADVDAYKANAATAAAELTWERESRVLCRAYARLLATPHRGGRPRRVSRP